MVSGIESPGPKPIAVSDVGHKPVTDRATARRVPGNVPDISAAAWMAALGPPIDLDRVTAIRDAIAAGNYLTDAPAIAAKLLGEATGNADA